VGSIPASRTKNQKAHNASCGLFLFQTVRTRRSLPGFKPCPFEHFHMSKAFTKESDGDEDEDFGLPALPAGARNYMTPAGYARMRAELFALMDDERPKVVEIVHWAASNGDRSENGDYLYGKKRLREIDRRIRFLTQRLEIAEVVDPAVHHGSDQVYFGATVTYAELAGGERTVTILGMDEADSLQAQVSWISPIARTLLKSREGDQLKLLTPAGVVDIEVVQVTYPAPN
jgi:transcription elongation factor GreB